MACSIDVDHLRKVASEGFPLIDEFSRRQGVKAYRPTPPPPRNQYVYHGPQAITVVQQPDTGNFHQIQTARNYERWYVCHVVQGPPAGEATISSNDAASNYGGMLVNDYGKAKQKQWT